MAVAAAELYITANTIPELESVRSQQQTEAWDVMNSRRERILMGSYEGVPQAVDALSTAAKVNEAIRVFGQNSDLATDLKAGLDLDSFRLLAEWRRKNTYELFEPLRHHRDKQTGEYVSNGMSVWKMTGDALSPSARTTGLSNSEEDSRRVNERVEEATAMAIGSLGVRRLLESMADIEEQDSDSHRASKLGNLALGSTVKLRTITECADWAIDDLNSGIKSGYGGYVPAIEKLMIRDMIFEPESTDRLEEQVALPGTYLNSYVIRKALRWRGLEVEGMSKTNLQGNQMIAGDDLLDFVALLDEVASEEWCVPVFMGELLPAGQEKDYGNVRAEAKRRQEELKHYAKVVSGYVLDLESEGVDRRKAPALVEEFVKRILINMAGADHALATEMFDEKTAQGLQEVAYLRSIGRPEEAFARLNEVEAAAPGGGYCGAGSCGLERVLAGTEEAKAIEKLGFDSKNSILDKERKCVKCSSKTVVYDLEKGKKGCTSCKATAKYK